jgi:hypothetical protein
VLQSGNRLLTMNSYWFRGSFVIAFLVAFLATIRTASANTILFAEDFSTDLSNWIGKNGGSHQGVIVADPNNPANRALSFSGLNLSGDIFTAASLSVGTQGQTVISFDYLGLPNAAANPENLGGFFGISIDLLPEGGDAAWIAGTEQSAANGLGFTGIELIDDGQWHRYEIDITSILTENNISLIHLMLEDWRDAGGIPGDAYFDNIQVTSVNVPETAGTLTYALISSAFLTLAKKRSLKAIRSELR